MAILKVYKFPDLVLSQKALPIEKIEKSFYQLAEDMLETMYDAPGVGLAANQVGILQRIIVIDTDYDLEEILEGALPPKGAEILHGSVMKNKNPRVMINPVIALKEGTQLYKEGCLSVPEFTAEIKRAGKLKLQYQDLDGKSKTLLAEGLLAVAIQHEIDHLDGRLFIDRLSPLKKELVKKRLKQERRERESGETEPEFSSKKKQKGF